MFARVLLLCTFIALSPFAVAETLSKKTLVLRYSDFGPPVIAHTVIGSDWWQWQPHGDSRPRDYPVKVVVYRSVSLLKVKAAYPVNAEKEQDYRYLTYQAACTYLDAQIEQNVLDEVTEDLEKTRAKIIAKFGAR